MLPGTDSSNRLSSLCQREWRSPSLQVPVHVQDKNSIDGISKSGRVATNRTRLVESGDPISSDGLFSENLLPLALVGILVCVLIGAMLLARTERSSSFSPNRRHLSARAKVASPQRVTIPPIVAVERKPQSTASNESASTPRSTGAVSQPASEASKQQKTTKVKTDEIRTVSYVPGSFAQTAFAPPPSPNPAYFPPPMYVESIRQWYLAQQHARLQEYYWQLNQLNRAAAFARRQAQIDFHNRYRDVRTPSNIARYQPQDWTNQLPQPKSQISQLQDSLQANAAALKALQNAQRATYQYPVKQAVGNIVPASNDDLSVPMPVPVLSRDAAAIPTIRADEPKRIAFNFRLAPWDIVLKRFAEDAGLALQLDAVPPGTFDYYDSTMYTPTEALDILNGFLMQKGFLLIRRDRLLVAIDSQNGIPAALIPHVHLEELPSRGRNELVSVIIEVPYSDVAKTAKELESLLGKLGHVAAVSDSNRLILTDFVANLIRIRELLDLDGSQKTSRPTEVYKLLHTKAEEIAKAINEFLTSQAQTELQRTPTANGDQINQRESVVVAEPNTNSILFGGPPSQMEKIRQLLAQLDQAPAQVVIQALLVEVELDNIDEYGVEIGIQDSILFNRSVIDNIVTLTQTTTSITGQQTTNENLISQTADPGFNFNNRPLGNNTAISPATVGGQALSNFGFGRINGDLGFGGLVLSAGSENISVLLRALAAERKVDILSRPQIRTVDNHPAQIQIGQKVPIVDGVTVTAVGSANPVIRQDEAGIILNVTPHISPDGSVMIDVVAEKSAFRTGAGSGVPIFTDATSGNVIEAPIKDITSAKTMVSVQSGETIVLGGMITKDLIDVKKRVPILGDIPYLGAAFRYKLDQVKRRELLIFLTPVLLKDPAQAERLKAREVGRTHFPLADATQMHGPILSNNSILDVRYSDAVFNGGLVPRPNGNSIPINDLVPNNRPPHKNVPSNYGNPNDNFFPDDLRIPNSGHTNEPFPAPDAQTSTTGSRFRTQRAPNAVSTAGYVDPTAGYVDRNGIPTVIIPYRTPQKPVPKRVGILDRLQQLRRAKSKQPRPASTRSPRNQRVPTSPTWGHSARVRH